MNGAAIRAVRERLAAALGVSRASLAAWEAGLARPRDPALPERLVRIAVAAEGRWRRRAGTWRSWRGAPRPPAPSGWCGSRSPPKGAGGGASWGDGASGRSWPLPSPRRPRWRGWRPCCGCGRR